MEIKNRKELEEANVLVKVNCLNMCNAKSIEEVAKAFTEAKDNLIAIYKYNVTRLQDKEGN